jgi:hypothetical protein
MKGSCLLATAVALATITGCRTVPSDSLGAFSSGVNGMRTQSQQAFAAVNELAADASVEYAAKQPHLAEASFAAGLDEESLQAWDEILQKIQNYAQHLLALTSPERGRQFADEAVNLGTELQDFGQHLAEGGLVNKSPSVSPGIASGFTELGKLIIEFQGQSHARHALVKADPEISRIFRNMADSIGATTTNGIRSTVHAHWDQRLADDKEAFLSADLDTKRKIASDFRDLLQRRSTQDLALASLRRSLLQLADLHHAVAQGEAWTAQSAVSAIQSELQYTRDLNARFSEK